MRIPGLGRFAGALAFVVLGAVHTPAQAWFGESSGTFRYHRPQVTPYHHMFGGPRWDYSAAYYGPSTFAGYGTKKARRHGARVQRADVFAEPVHRLASHKKLKAKACKRKWARHCKRRR